MIALKLHLLPVSGSVWFLIKNNCLSDNLLEEILKDTISKGSGKDWLGSSIYMRCRGEFLLFEFLLRGNICGTHARDWLSGINDGNFCNFLYKWSGRAATASKASRAGAVHSAQIESEPQVEHRHSSVLVFWLARGLWYQYTRRIYLLCHLSVVRLELVGPFSIALTELLSIWRAAVQK